ncbi:MAG TPA: hypothetical protein PLB10_01055 [Thiolinea sp.]|nr:hypothetical protein [Thiolinea sp.]
MLKGNLGLVFIVVLGALGGCNSSGQQQAEKVTSAANTTTARQPSEEGLRSRVQGRWDALIKRDFAQAYQYMSPGYRKLYPISVFTSGFGAVVAWDSITVTSIQVAQGSASAKVTLELFYQLALPGTESLRPGEGLGLISKTLHEDWIWADSEWWFIDPLN